MPLPDPESFCVELDPSTGFKLGLDLGFNPFDLVITMPGGATLQAFGAVPQRMAYQLIDQLNAALTPLTPIFDLIDMGLLLFKVLDKLKSLDVFGTLKAFPDFSKAIDKLKGLIPQVSIPLMIKTVIGALLAALAVLRTDFNALVQLQAKIDTGRVRAAALGSSDLSVTLDCAAGQLDAQLSLLQSRARPLNRLLGVLNLLTGIAGIGSLPTLEFSGDASASMTAIDSVMAALRTARSAIP